MTNIINNVSIKYYIFYCDFFFLFCQTALLPICSYSFFRQIGGNSRGVKKAMGEKKERKSVYARKGGN